MLARTASPPSPATKNNINRRKSRGIIIKRRWPHERPYYIHRRPKIRGGGALIPRLPHYECTPEACFIVCGWASRPFPASHDCCPFCWWREAESRIMAANDGDGNRTGLVFELRKSGKLHAASGACCVSPKQSIYAPVASCKEGSVCSGVAAGGTHYLGCV